MAKHNTLKLDAIREEIEQLSLEQMHEKAVALTSLILAMDEVDSTMGHYFLPERMVTTFLSADEAENSENHSKSARARVHQGDIFNIAPSIDADLAYYDPPYGGSNNDKMPPSRVRYAAYYHLWTSICLFDNPPLFGETTRTQRRAERLRV